MLIQQKMSIWTMKVDPGNWILAQDTVHAQKGKADCVCVCV